MLFADVIAKYGLQCGEDGWVYQATIGNRTLSLSFYGRNQYTGARLASGAVIDADGDFLICKWDRTPRQIDRMFDYQLRKVGLCRDGSTR